VERGAENSPPRAAVFSQTYHGLGQVTVQSVTKRRQDEEAGSSVNLQHYSHLVLESLSDTTVVSAEESNAHDCSALIDKICFI
jgi:hypothetical protein